MPKENINCPVMRGFRAEVTWAPNIPGERIGHVQLATVNTKSELTLPADVDGEPPVRFEGWYVTLEPDGIDRLIDALEKARAAAFG